MDFKLKNKQNYTNIELTKKLDLIQKDKIILTQIQNKILVNIYEDKIYDKIIDIFEHINKYYIYNQYGNNTEYITIYNDIIICIENDTDYNYSYLNFIFVKTNTSNNDLELLNDIFKFLIE
jgi:hypothetical protein